MINPAPLSHFGDFVTLYKCNHLLTYLLTYLLSYGVFDMEQ